MPQSDAQISGSLIPPDHRKLKRLKAVQLNTPAKAARVLDEAIAQLRRLRDIKVTEEVQRGHALARLIEVRISIFRTYDLEKRYETLLARVELQEQRRAAGLPFRQEVGVQ